MTGAIGPDRTPEGAVRMGDAEGPFERAASRGEGPLSRAFIGSRLAPITACGASVM